MSETLDTYLLLRAFADELARCGVAGACTSPGSRSTPLVLSLVREERLPCWSHVDERCAGFFGLGVAKATGRPVALACTSGTAAANYLPAVVEAYEARVPLIVLTADRPPELRGVGAGQAIDQVKLYGDAVKWFVEVGTHAATPARLRWMRQLACRAVWTAAGGRPGPVHLNFPLREPLVLDEQLPPDESGRPDGRPWVARIEPAADADAAAATLEPILRGAARGIVVAGRHERRRPALADAAVAFAAAAGWPLLADPLSGARRGPNAVAHYDALLRVDALAEASTPDVVLRVGDLPTSKPLRAWLAAADAVQVLLDPDAAWQDPDGVADLALGVDPAAVLAALAQGLRAASPNGGAAAATPLSGWLAADARAAGAIDATLGDGLTEPQVAAELGRGLPPEATLLVAASMPIRDVETFFPARDDPPRVLSNRGANGIDGTISTAFGIAAGSDGPVVALLGDVTLAHDIGGLLAAKRLRLPLTIVLLDNGGGGIFDFLPVSTQRDAYEEHVATPTGLDAERVADLYGLVYAQPSDLAQLRVCLDAGLASDEVTLLHVRTDRAANVALHRRCWDAVAAALS
ncbi:MAG TPA: 2-succinyl-5-enolpyruvyl-6-hydroxy-3-cyclohexene-1-carboxylic-acid synthase [Solirubrobacteraceae bacterium]